MAPAVDMSPSPRVMSGGISVASPRRFPGALGSLPPMTINNLDCEELCTLLYRCEWADASFIRSVKNQGWNGAQLLGLTKRDLKETCNITQLGVIKEYLREIQALNADRANRSNLSSAMNSLLDMDLVSLNLSRENTPHSKRSPELDSITPSFSTTPTPRPPTGQSTGSPAPRPGSGSPVAGGPSIGTDGLVNGRTLAGSDHKRLSRSSIDTQDRPSTPSRPPSEEGNFQFPVAPSPVDAVSWSFPFRSPERMTSPSAASHVSSVLSQPLRRAINSAEPPTVATLEEYMKLRGTPNASVDDFAADRFLRKKKKKRAASVTSASSDIFAARRSMELDQQLEDEFCANKEPEVRAAWDVADREGKGYISTRHGRLDALLKALFPKFTAPPLADYGRMVVDYCDPDRTGKIEKEIFVACILEQLCKTSVAFRMVDLDGSGSIDYLELEKLVKAVFPSQSPAEQKKIHKKIVEDCDVSGEGQIDLDEFVMSQYASLMAGPAEYERRKRRRAAKLEELFQSVDTDNSGNISHSEMRSLIERVFPDFSTRQQDAFFNVVIAECDKNNDGDIDFDEFVKSSHANLMLAEYDNEDDAPQAQRKGRSRVMDRGAHSVGGGRKTRSEELRQKKTYRMTALGNTTTEENSHGGKYSANAAAERRKKREDTAKEHKKANMSEARRKSLAVMEQVSLELEHEKRMKARDVMSNQTRTQEVGYTPGILEEERRLAAVKRLFVMWDESSDISRNGSGFVEYEELREVLKRFFNWTDEEATNNCDSIMEKMDQDLSGTLDFDEFCAFVRSITAAVIPKNFDLLMRFLFDAIADFSTDQEHDRRVKLLSELFNVWDYDGGGDIDQTEVYRVMTRFNNEMKEGKRENSADLMFSGADADGDGRLDSEEFVTFFDDITYQMKPEEFDFVMYRLHRCLEEVQILLEGNSASLKYKATLLNTLENGKIEAILASTSPLSPIVMYGTSFDPARAVEKYAKGLNHEVQPFLVTHDKAEDIAMEGIRKALRAGNWCYLVLGRGYNSDLFLRKVGKALFQTSNAQAHSVTDNFRLWVCAPVPNTNAFPQIITRNARFLYLDEIDPSSLTLSKSELRKLREEATGRKALI